MRSDRPNNHWRSCRIWRDSISSRFATAFEPRVSIWKSSRSSAGSPIQTCPEDCWRHNLRRPAGTELFDPNDLLLVMSAGGPAVTWDDVPLNLQELAAENYLVDRTEPVLELKMQAGLVYKTDALLLGDCFAVDQARNTFYDGSFASLCDVGEPEVVVSWLADGSMFVVEGLPPQGIHPSIGTEIVWTDEPRLAGPQYWTPSERLEPSVVVDGDAILVTGGYHQFNLIPALDGAMAEQIAALIEPLDIRGSLVIQLTPPLGFSSRGYWGARSLQGTTFAAFEWFDAVSTTNGIEYSWNPLIENKAITTSVAATTWKVIRNATWQYALPAGWVTPSSNSPDGDSPLVAATFEDTSTGKWCEIYPVGSLSQIGPTDAFVGVYYGSSTDSNLWLDHFVPDDIAQVSVSDPVPECLEGTDAEVRTSSRFYDGTALDIMIGFGADVTPETRKQAFAILDSFETLPVYGDP